MRTRAAGSFAQLLDGYLAMLRLRPASCFLAELVLPRLFAHLRARHVHDLRAVNEAHLVSFARRLGEEPGGRGRVIKPASRRAFLSAVRGFFAHLERRRLILTNPAAELPLPKVQRLPGRVPSEAQARRLMAAPFPGSVLGKRDRAILELLYGTGLRSAECRRLDLADVQLCEGTLLVRDGKGRKDRLVPLRGRAAAALDLYLRESRPELVTDSREAALFVSARGARLGSAGLGILVRRHGRAAKLPMPVSPHVLRHTCATHLLKGGADVRHVQQLLGHRRLDTTALYTRVDISDLQAVVRRAHPREREVSRRGRAAGAAAEAGRRQQGRRLQRRR
ncbi:MAG: tyrosine-type recombinase/integrase [Thermoanaerobaculaceae bacterium]|nr:tyrosine-type recombinase/integrase [Thermoanaerobaculaceae bacterium]